MHYLFPAEILKKKGQDEEARPSFGAAEKK
jgi:hypothetical protein